jgi:hypothetical protein
MAVIILSNHAKKRLKERKIQESLVRQCLAKPDKVSPATAEEEEGG